MTTIAGSCSPESLSCKLLFVAFVVRVFRLLTRPSMGIVIHLSISISVMN